VVERDHPLQLAPVPRVVLGVEPEKASNPAFAAWAGIIAVG